MKILILSFAFLSTIYSCQKKGVNIENTASKKVDKIADAQSLNIQIDSLETKGSDITAHDLTEIQTLIRKTYVWLDVRKLNEGNGILNKKGTEYIGFNLTEHKANIILLKNTGFFSISFIENYDKILLKQDSIIRNREAIWRSDDFEPFENVGADWWCDCQDYPYDKPEEWNFLLIQTINLKKGEFVWVFGDKKSKPYVNMQDHPYKFRVIKENEKWKISYLEGFDFAKRTKINKFTQQ